MTLRYLLDTNIISEPLRRTPSFVDGQIAAIAKVHELVVVTHNIKRYQGFREIEVQDWI